jgi:hypothetical protein
MRRKRDGSEQIKSFVDRELQQLHYMQSYQILIESPNRSNEPDKCQGEGLSNDKLDGD